MRQVVKMLVQVPWPEVTRVAVTALLCLVVWLLTKHHYAREWEKWAPEKARDALLEARRQRDMLARRVVRLEGQVAKMRGQIAAARVRLDEPAALELVEKAQ
jgi:hypothetical protein